MIFLINFTNACMLLLGIFCHSHIYATFSGLVYAMYMNSHHYAVLKTLLGVAELPVSAGLASVMCLGIFDVLAHE